MDNLQQKLMHDHAMGILIRHKDPFSELETIQNDTPLAIDFFHKWVRSSPGGMEGFIGSQWFIESCKAINHDTVMKLFGDRNWRSRMSAACYCAVRNFSEMEELIGNLLLKSEVCFTGLGYAIALASFNTERSIDYMIRYLEYYLTQKKLQFNQDTVMGALLWLDRQNQTYHADKFIALWQDYAVGHLHLKSLTLENLVGDFDLQMQAVFAIRQRLIECSQNG